MFTVERPSVHDYSCYRRFLADWFQAEKARHPRFSHRVFASRAGYTSSALLPLIIQHKRNLTERYFEGFVRALELSPRDASVFRALVDLGNARDDATRRKCEGVLHSVRQGGVRRIDSSRARYYESWIHVALYQALDCLEISDDLSPLREFLRPAPTLEELRASLALLAKLEMIERDDRGIWRIRNSNLLGEASTGPWVLRGFQEQMLDLGKTAHERFASGRTVARTETLSVGAKAADRIRERMRRCLDEIVEIALSDQSLPETVIQVNAQLFPLSEVHAR